MRIVVLGDLHLVAPDAEDAERQARRRHFAEAYPSFRRLARAIRAEAPDLVVSLGDLVDWYSPRNRDFALQELAALGAPWLLTPGNHDLECHHAWHGRPAGAEAARAGWAAAGVDLGDRAIVAGEDRLLLMDSADSRTTPATEAWLRGAVHEGGRRFLFTHVPLRHDAVREFIVATEPQRNLAKYLQHGDLWADAIAGRVTAAFTGHLHFPGRLAVDGVDLHLLPLGVTAVDRAYPGQGAATVLETTPRDWRVRTLTA